MLSAHKMQSSFNVYIFALFKLINILIISLIKLIINFSLIKMDKPLALEYSGEKKWYSYRMFEPLRDGQSDSESS